MKSPIILFLSLLFLVNVLSAQEKPDSLVDKWIVWKILDGSETPSGSLREVNAIDLDSEGNLFILDGGRNRLLKYSPDGLFLKEVGGFGNSADEFNFPRDLDAHRTLNIFVADYNNNRVVRLDKNLNYLNEFVLASDNPFYFEMPLSVAVNNQYDIFILEDLNKRIIKLDRFNQPMAAFGRASENLGQLLGPHQLALGNRNEIYVSDPLKKAIIVFDPLGNFLKEIIHPEFIEPRGIFLTPDDQLLVADTRGRKIFLYLKGGKFQEILDVKLFPTDVALWKPPGNRPSYLYVSGSEKCIIFSQERVNP